MRFCPFCAHENADDTAQCARCGKRLPPPRKSAGAGGGVDGRDAHAGALPAPPPPSDYKVPLHTPTLLRDATSSPHVVALDDDGAAEEHRPVVPPPPIPRPALPEDVIDTAPQQTLSPLDRARMAGERAWK